MGIKYNNFSGSCSGAKWESSITISVALVQGQVGIKCNNFSGFCSGAKWESSITIWNVSKMGVAPKLEG